MAKYEVCGAVCDYGIFEDGELKLIVNNKKTADAIVTLLELDRDCHKELQKDSHYEYWYTFGVGENEK